jgi:hypothetical protein
MSLFSPRAQPIQIFSLPFEPSPNHHLPAHPILTQPYPYVRRDLYPFVCIVEQRVIHSLCKSIQKYNLEHLIWFVFTFLSFIQII